MVVGPGEYSSNAYVNLRSAEAGYEAESSVGSDWCGEGDVNGRGPRYPEAAESSSDDPGYGSRSGDSRSENS